ncbi:MAG: flagellar biosynthetic protein FliR [Verrucomicrobia bacterium]|nr:flagellar biosynthetic protein FliR [Verrucomicrobiota bacterium]
MSGDPANWMLVFVRASAFLLVLPVFSAPNIPHRVRLALAALLATLIAPSLPARPAPGPDFTAWIGLFALETLSGLTIGFVTRMVFYVADFAGRLISNEMGLNLANTFNPMAGESTQSPGLILFYFSATVLMALDLHHWVLVGFHNSYRLLPRGRCPPHRFALHQPRHSHRARLRRRCPHGRPPHGRLRSSSCSSSPSSAAPCPR